MRFRFFQHQPIRSTLILVVLLLVAGGLSVTSATATTSLTVTSEGPAPPTVEVAPTGPSPVFAFTVSNGGPDPGDVTLSAAATVGTSGPAANISAMSYSTDGAATWNPCNPMACIVSGVPNDGSPVGVQVTVDPPGSSDCNSNSADNPPPCQLLTTLTAKSGADTASDSGSATVTYPDLAVVKTGVSPSTVEVSPTGPNPSYTFTVKNGGTGDGHNVKLDVTGTLVGSPTAVTPVSALWTKSSPSDPGGSCGSTFTGCNIGMLVAGQVATVTVVLQSPASADCDAYQTSGKCTLSAKVAASEAEGDPTSGDDWASGSATVTYPDLAVTIAITGTQNNTTAAIGALAPITYQVTVKNHGSGDAHNVSLTNYLPTGLSLVPPTNQSPNPSGVDWTCTSSPQSQPSPPTPPVSITSTCPYGLTLTAVTGSTTVKFAATAPAIASTAGTNGTIQDRASADDNEVDPTAGDSKDQLSATTDVHDGYLLIKSPGGSLKTPSIDQVHGINQAGVLTVPKGIITSSFPAAIDDTFSTAFNCSVFPTGYKGYGNPVRIVGPLNTTSKPNTVQLIYSSNSTLLDANTYAGIPIQIPLGQIDVFRVAPSAPAGTCVELPKCTFRSNQYFIPAGQPACIQTISRQTPTGIVTITLLETDTGDPLNPDPYLKSGG
jgi:uncharacterized repeat protein (TIGR01451 family)